MTDIIREGGKRMGRNFARIREEAEKLIAENKRLRDERDALASRLERVIAFGDDPSGGGMKDDPLWEDLKAECHETSLAQRDARLRSVIEGEVMDRIVRGLPTSATRDEVVECLSQEHQRRQAEGGE